jgi:hypothetical protein
MREFGNSVIRVIDPEGEIVPIEPPREEVVTFPDLKGYSVPERLFEH